MGTAACDRASSGTPGAATAVAASIAPATRRAAAAAPVLPTQTAIWPPATSISCPTPLASDVLGADADTARWLTYRDPEHGFSVSYPPGWQVVQEHGLDGSAYARFLAPGADEWAWTAAFLPASAHEATGGADLGRQFADRRVTRRQIWIGGLPAEIVTVSTCQVDGWYAQKVSVRRAAGMFVFTNGARRDRAFDGFYASARFGGELVGQ